MASASMNQYEKQLYSVFKTFDVDNEETLDRSAVLQLCDTLQLEDRGAALVDTLFQQQGERVTFAQFRNGLLSVLGSDVASPQHSDDDSSGREVAPKFVFGSKKYGRRSRPQRVAAEDSPRHRVASESRLDSARSKQRMRCKRSASAMESRDDCTVDDETADLDHDRRVNRDRALALCRGLHMNGVDHSLVNRIFEASSSEEITVGEFFDQLNFSLATSIAASLDGVSNDSSSKSKAEVLSCDAVVDVWDRAGVERPRRLLMELGFTDAGLRPHELERALDDELRALAAPSETAPDARTLLLLASNALARMRLDSAWRLLDVARAERDKLRDDLVEANRRARLLAQDVDENHARIEAELKSSLRQVEARHAEATRAASAEAAVERERAASARLALEEEAGRRADTEARLRTETVALRERIEELQERVRTADTRAQQAEREQVRLQEEARAAEVRGEMISEHERLAIEELNGRLHDLRLENQRVRDRNDELCAELEASARRAVEGSDVAPSWREEVAMQVSPIESHLPAKLEVCNVPLSLSEKKPLDAKEVINKVQHVIGRIERLPLPSGGGCPTCYSIGETVAALQRLVHNINEDVAGTDLQSANRTEIGLQTDSIVNNDITNAETFKQDLANMKQQHEMDKKSLTSVIKELELSLEQMKIEYDKCEEYWTCKLEDEREIFADEQRAGDERLAELVAKIAEYERQFAPAHSLPTIDEKYSLELQFSDLEDEFSKYKSEKETEVASKVEEIKKLKGKVEELERIERVESAGAGASRERDKRPLVLHCAGAELQAQLRRQNNDNAVCVCTCACACGGVAARWRAGEAGALRARAARAERAAQRLQARLATADLLVKDLYIENCRLAHLPHLPPPPHASRLP